MMLLISATATAARMLSPCTIIRTMMMMLGSLSALHHVKDGLGQCARRETLWPCAGATLRAGRSG